METGASEVMAVLPETPGEAQEGQRKRLGYGERLMTVGEVADYLRVSPKTIYNWVSMGLIPCIRRRRGMVRFKLDKVEKWLLEFEQKGRKRRKIDVVMPV